MSKPTKPTKPTNKLVALAYQHGSTATTPAGAKRYLKNIWMDSDGLRISRAIQWIDGQYPQPQSSRQNYFGRDIARHADRRAEILGYPLTTNPEYINYCKTYEYNRTLDAWTQLASTAKLDDRILPDGNIIQYREDTEWEKYGNHSYPRIVNRRIDVISKPTFDIPGINWQLLRRLAGGERAEAVIDALVPGRADRRAEIRQLELMRPKTCYKCVARRESGILVSIFDGQTIYQLGAIISDHVHTRADNQCTGGGIFVHATPERAIAQEYPDRSRAADLPRVLLRGEYWGRCIINGKISAEYFRPTEIIRSEEVANV